MGKRSLVARDQKVRKGLMGREFSPAVGSSAGEVSIARRDTFSRKAMAASSPKQTQRSRRD